MSGLGEPPSRCSCCGLRVHCRRRVPAAHEWPANVLQSHHLRICPGCGFLCIDRNPRGGEAQSSVGRSSAPLSLKPSSLVVSDNAGDHGRSKERDARSWQSFQPQECAETAPGSSQSGAATRFSSSDDWLHEWLHSDGPYPMFPWEKDESNITLLTLWANEAMDKAVEACGPSSVGKCAQAAAITTAMAKLEAELGLLELSKTEAASTFGASDSWVQEGVGKAKPSKIMQRSIDADGDALSRASSRYHDRCSENAQSHCSAHASETGTSILDTDRCMAATLSGDLPEWKLVVGSEPATSMYRHALHERECLKSAGLRQVAKSGYEPGGQQQADRDDVEAVMMGAELPAPLTLRWTCSTSGWVPPQEFGQRRARAALERIRQEARAGGPCGSSSFDKRSRSLSEAHAESGQGEKWLEGTQDDGTRGTHQNQEHAKSCRREEHTARSCCTDGSEDIENLAGNTAASSSAHGEKDKANHPRVHENLHEISKAEHFCDRVRRAAAAARAVVATLGARSSRHSITSSPNGAALLVKPSVENTEAPFANVDFAVPSQISASAASTVGHSTRHLHTALLCAPEGSVVHIGDINVAAGLVPCSAADSRLRDRSATVLGELIEHVGPLARSAQAARTNHKMNAQGRGQNRLMARTPYGVLAETIASTASSNAARAMLERAGVAHDGDQRSSTRHTPVVPSRNESAAINAKDKEDKSSVERRTKRSVVEGEQKKRQSTASSDANVSTLSMAGKGASRRSTGTWRANTPPTTQARQHTQYKRQHAATGSATFTESRRANAPLRPGSAASASRTGSATHALRHPTLPPKAKTARGVNYHDR